VGFLFAIMGAGGVWATTLGRGKMGKKKKPGSRIDTLDGLRRDGTLTGDEFETLKNKIVRED